MGLVNMLLVAFMFCLTSERDVQILSDSNFTDVINNCSRLLIHFKVPVCKACKKFQPEYSELLKSVDDTIQFAEVDSLSNNNITLNYNIMGFPTLLLIKNSTAIKYAGDMKANKIIEWLHILDQPLYTEIKDINQLTDESPHIVAINPTAQLLNTLEQIKLEMLSLKIYHHNTGQCIKSNQCNTSVIFKQFAKSKIKEIVIFSYESIMDTIKYLSIPYVWKFSKHTQSYIFNTNKPMLWMITDNDTINEEAFEECAKKYSEYVFVLLNADEDYSRLMLSQFNVQEIPSYAFVKRSNFKLNKYISPRHDNITTQLIDSIISDFKNETIPEYFKTEKKPLNASIKRNNLSVTKIVSETLKQYAQQDYYVIYEPLSHSVVCNSLLSSLAQLKAYVPYLLNIGIYAYLENENELVKIQKGCFSTIYTHNGTNNATLSSSNVTAYDVYKFIHSAIPEYVSNVYIADSRHEEI